MFSQSGIPVIYSGDEIGQVNDYSYKDDPEKSDDSRYLHRGKFDWKLAENRHDPATVQGKLFPMLDKKMVCTQILSPDVRWKPKVCRFLHSDAIGCAEINNNF